ncbi:MAG: hypothetical protein AAFR12_11330 [Cyanobacteria bacterium J06626_6]
MERWNELIAGHVLDNLTEEEQAELSQVLAEQPKLMTEISRLRRTATLRSTQQSESSVDGWKDSWKAGAEGWADTVSQALEQGDGTYSFQDDQPKLVTNSVNLPSQQHGCLIESLPQKSILQSTRAWFGLVLVALIAVSIDNWRMRRLMAIAQEQILQLESTAEYIPTRSD